MNWKEKLKLIAQIVIVIVMFEMLNTYFLPPEVYDIFHHKSAGNHYTVYVGARIWNEMRIVEMSRSHATFKDNDNHQLIIGCPWYAEEEP